MKTGAGAIETLDPAIRQHRTATTTVTLSHNGSPLAHQDVLVEQKKHRFLFGSNWGESSIALANGELGFSRKISRPRLWE